jgi:hypothetical protein
VDRSLDLWGERAQTLVVARLTWQVGEQVREPVAGERQKLAVVRSPMKTWAIASVMSSESII